MHGATHANDTTPKSFRCQVKGQILPSGTHIDRDTVQQGWIEHVQCNLGPHTGDDNIVSPFWNSIADGSDHSPVAPSTEVTMVLIAAASWPRREAHIASLMSAGANNFIFSRLGG
mmetsp:Transcript_6633/g.13933  ORF Transcript_6633/g.13933 Transcript_6633/m.13933 type:complete len:115 (+) Transcript_6633:181-525(+)